MFNAVIIVFFSTETEPFPRRSAPLSIQRCVRISNSNECQRIRRWRFVPNLPLIVDSYVTASSSPPFWSPSPQNWEPMLWHTQRSQGRFVFFV
jgi:hypothetical protein